MGFAQNSLKRFSIKGLHGDKDISFSFDGPYKIIVSENGTGKTTALNSLFFALSGQFNKLSQVDFIELELVTESDSVKIKREELSFYIPESLSEMPAISRLTKYLGEELVGKLVEKVANGLPVRELRTTKEFRVAMSRYPGPSSDIMRSLSKANYFISKGDLFTGKLAEKKEKIKSMIPLEVFYLPTYRRVEEDLQSLGYDGDFESNQEQLIQFGMRDVSRRLKNITAEIKESAVTWYSKMSGRMLDELMTGVNIDREKIDKIKNPDALEIVLDRLGKNISKDRKADIIELVQSEKIYSERYNSLAYFLSNLVEVYDQQREKDNKIQAFVDVANKYLVGKEIQYDESNVTIDVVNIRTGKDVLLEKLSSGEKQLISIFSKLYLESSAQNFIIFDEPELSLSIEWQKTLLPDIIASGQCGFLIAATHSPFIFENELDQYAEALPVEYREVESE
ncbi:AAA family ATPase [Halomonas sp. LBP4]|uniref:AAA family ATPase n=1 Tax=Halomonas sp. LBP4 TaxID=2044917 RepID=UPI000D75102D|nr:AAA family ATPase [Halomonas sp. LBP4]PXX98598.1 ATP/GTP-binding protein [Halomonas sp. LBP4]